MKKFLTKLRGIKIEYTRTHPLTKTAIGALLVLSLAALLALAWTGGNLRAEIRDMQKEALRLETENADLKEKTDNPDAVDAMEAVAEDELDMVDPDTIIIDPKP